MQTKAAPAQSEAAKATANAAASVSTTANAFQRVAAEEEESLQMKTANEQLPPGYTRNPLQMRQPCNNPFQRKESDSPIFQGAGYKTNPLVPIRYDNPFQLKGSNQNPLTLTTYSKYPLQKKEVREGSAVQMKQGVAIKDDKELEGEVGIMGNKVPQSKIDNEANIEVAEYNSKIINHAVQRMFDPNNNSQEKRNGKNFNERAIERLSGLTEEEKEQDQCGPSARTIYDKLRIDDKSAEKKGVGTKSLVDAIIEAKESSAGNVFIFYIDAEIIGHFFTILVSGPESVIIQGHVDKIKIIDNISEGGGARTVVQTDVIIARVEKLMNLRETVKNSDADADNIDAVANEFATLYGGIFGVSMDQKNIDRLAFTTRFKKNHEIEWHRSLAEKSEEKKESNCILS